MTGEPAAGVAVVTVNYNTAELMGLLLWSLHTRLAPEQATEIVVVDNASRDGSAELLRAAAEAGLCRLIANQTNVHHGPALNQAMDLLTELAGAGHANPRWVWILDSDCVVAGPDVLAEVVGLVEGSGAAVVGEPEWDPWHQVSRYGAHCLLIDPEAIWRDPIAPFESGGDPSFGLQTSGREEGLSFLDFPFLCEGYVIHRGRGSLAGVAEREERANPLYEWAVGHQDPHFGGVEGAADHYRSLAAAYRAQVAELSPTTLIAACLDPRAPA